MEENNTKNPLLPSEIRVAGEDEHCPTRLRSSEPDVSVIVGGELFRHYSVILSTCSDYFDAMLSSNMKEGSTKVIEFPDKDPNEWKLVYKFFEPAAASHADLSVHCIEVLAPWMSELGMTGALSCCDRSLHSFIVKYKEVYRKSLKGHEKASSKSKDFVKTVLEYAGFSALYGMPDTMQECLTILKCVLEKSLMNFDMVNSIRDLVSLSTFEAPRKFLLPSVRKLLPSIVEEIDEEDLVKNDLLAGMIYQAVKLTEARKQKCH